jgi:hypothetical protein
MIPSVVNTQTETPRNQLAGLSTTIDELNSLLFGRACPTNYDITSQIPLWIIQEKKSREEDGLSGVNVFDFLQKYYDWLYCDNESGAQYELSQDFLDLIDIDRTRSQFLERLADTYANGFVPEALESNGGAVSEENLRKFLNGIRRAIHQKKTTEDAIRYFFIKLFGVSEENIGIDVPKKNILRLNGGRFPDSVYSFPIGRTGDYDITNDLSGSHLNGSRMQDGNWIQDWSYLIKTGVDVNSYKQIYKDIMHPAGLKIVYEHLLSDYQGPLFDEDNPTVCELPILRNYSGYVIGNNYSSSTSNLYIADGWTAEAAAQGFTFIGLNYQAYCVNGNTGFSGPTHLFPNWNGQYTTNTMFDINISTLIEMCYPAELGSPNSGSECTIMLPP